MESIYHIETDLECRVLHYGADLCIAKPEQSAPITLRKGKHILTFISTENTQDQYTIFYEVPENDIEDRIEVKLRGIRQKRLDKEAEEKKHAIEAERRRQLEMEEKRIERQRSERKELERMKSLERDNWETIKQLRKALKIADEERSCKTKITGLNTKRGEISVPQAVDLGLSVKWASFNLGASKPEEYGDYYAWGETELKYAFNSRTYKWSYKEENYPTKYCPNNKRKYWYGLEAPDGKESLDLDDDVANVKLGGIWRIPTSTEFKELCKKCTWTWTTLNGVNGYKVTGCNNNSIFLPATGGYTGNNLGDLGSSGRYWSSTLDSDYPVYAWCGVFNIEKVLSGFNVSRYWGLSIRPVTD